MIKTEKYSFSRENKADFSASEVKLSADGTSFVLNCQDKEFHINMHMTGTFNVENVSAVFAACSKFGIKEEKIISVISKYPGVKGRCEIIPTGRDFTVICDYAHTPDAVENILSSVKEYCRGRLICLFGCGGNRDSSKRPKMAQAASKYADILVVTSDNPRNEEPEDIINDILKGLESSKSEYIVIADRREAIYKSLAMAKRNDIIVLAGKGHEDYQILKNDVRIHFDEREVVAEGLKLLK